MATDTWDVKQESTVPISEILRVVKECLPIDGVTISGGEPLDQADDLADLLTGLRELIGPEGDLLCYTGRTTHVVTSHYSHILGMVDAMVTGPYNWRRPSEDPLRGSLNQEVITTTPLGVERYGHGTDHRELQVNIDEDKIYTIGVPATGDLAALEAAAAAAGLSIDQPSWREGI